MRAPAARFPTSLNLSASSDLCPRSNRNRSIVEIRTSRRKCVLPARYKALERFQDFEATTMPGRPALWLGQREAQNQIAAAAAAIAAARGDRDELFAVDHVDRR